MAFRMGFRNIGMIKGEPRENSLQEGSLKRKANHSKFKPRRSQAPDDPAHPTQPSAARDREGMDCLRALSQKDPGTFIKSGTRGQHIVHQK
jgi:hypothetical protein